MKIELLPIYNRLISGDVTSSDEFIKIIAEHDSSGQDFLDYCDEAEKRAVLIAFDACLQRLTSSESSELLSKITKKDAELYKLFNRVELMPASNSTSSTFYPVYYFVFKHYAKQDWRDYLGLSEASVAAAASSAAVKSEAMRMRDRFLFNQMFIVMQMNRYLNKGRYVFSCEHGFCHGFSICAAALGTIGKLDWWYQLLTYVALWDPEKDSLDEKLILRDGSTLTYAELFEKVIHYLTYHQGRRNPIKPKTTWEGVQNFFGLFDEKPSIKHSDTLPRQSAILKVKGPFELLVKQDGTDEYVVKRIQNELSACGNFAVDDLKILLNDSLLRKPNVMVVISSAIHACALIYDHKTERFCFDDSNIGPRFFAHSMEGVDNLAALILKQLDTRLHFCIASLDKQKLHFKSYEDLLAGRRRSAIVWGFLSTLDQLCFYPIILLHLLRRREISFGSWFMDRIICSSSEDLGYALGWCAADGDSVLAHLYKDMVQLTLFIDSKALVLAEAVIKYCELEGDVDLALKLISTATRDHANMLRAITDNTVCQTVLQAVNQRLLRLKTEDPRQYNRVLAELDNALTDAHSPYRNLCGKFCGYGKTPAWQAIMAGHTAVIDLSASFWISAKKVAHSEDRIIDDALDGPARSAVAAFASAAGCSN